MQLSFLGQFYTASASSVEAISTPDTAVFLGRTYARKQFNVTQRQQLPSELTYRGIRYNH